MGAALLLERAGLREMLQATPLHPNPDLNPNPNYNPNPNPIPYTLYPIPYTLYPNPNPIPNPNQATPLQAEALGAASDSASDPGMQLRRERGVSLALQARYLVITPRGRELGAG